MITKPSTVRIYPHQKKWVRSNHINLSSMVREMLDEKIQRGVIDEKKRVCRV